MQDKAETKVRSGKKSKGGKEQKETRGKRNKKYASFKVYILRMLKNMHGEHGITKNGMSVMNSFAHDLMDKIAVEAGCLARYQKRNTMSGDHVIGAIKLVLPPGLAEQSIENAKKALESYKKAVEKEQKH